MEKEFSALSFQVTVCCLFNLLYVSAALYSYVFNGTHQCYINRFSIAWNTLCLPPDFGLAIFFWHSHFRLWLMGNNTSSVWNFCSRSLSVIRLTQQQNGNVTWRRCAQIKQLAWPNAERQIWYRKWRTVLSRRLCSRSVAKSAYSAGRPVLPTQNVSCFLMLLRFAN